MNLKISSYRFAKEILQHSKYSLIYNEIKAICSKCPLPVYKGKSDNQTKKDVVQQVMNTYFFKKFTDLSWDTEPLATPTDYEDELRSDFKKNYELLSSEDNVEDDNVIIQAEVEFGNSASSYRNYFKYQLSYSYDLADIGLLILPTYNLSKRIDTGVAYYKKALREIPSAKLSITIPILIVGLDCNNIEEWNIKEEVSHMLIRRNIPAVEKILKVLNKIYNDIKSMENDEIKNSLDDFMQSDEIIITQIEETIDKMKSVYPYKENKFNEINKKIEKLKLDIVKGHKNIYKYHEHSKLVNNFIERQDYSSI